MLRSRWRHIIFTFALLMTLALVVLIFNGDQPDAGRSSLYSDQFITVFRPAEQMLHDPRDATNVTVLLNLVDFRYLLEPVACTNVDDLLGLIIVTSYAGHDELRSAHRQAWPDSLLARLRFRRVFLLAALPSGERLMTQSALADEQLRFGDLLQGNFVEAYRNLTYKHTMGLRWASQRTACEAPFIVKADDDTVFDAYHLHEHLLGLLDTDLARSDELLAGFVLAAQRPIRNAASKWFVTADEFAGDRYPNYLSGWLYISSPATARRLVEQAYRQRDRFLWIDDTWVTGVLRTALDIPLVPLNRWFSANAQFIECCVADVRRWQRRCDYSVGPNGGDGRLMIEFARAQELCLNDGCVERTPDQSLFSTCVGRHRSEPQAQGRALVEQMQL